MRLHESFFEACVKSLMSTRIWAALQDVSGGTWGGAVYDADAILRVIAAGKRAPAES